mgnify:CR=1 FL=1
MQLDFTCEPTLDMYNRVARRGWYASLYRCCSRSACAVSGSQCSLHDTRNFSETMSPALIRDCNRYVLTRKISLKTPDHVPHNPSSSAVAILMPLKPAMLVLVTIQVDITSEFRLNLINSATYRSEIKECYMVFCSRSRIAVE